MMKKIAIIVAISIAALTSGCATTSVNHSHDVWQTWGTDSEMSPKLNEVVNMMAAGEIVQAEQELTRMAGKSDPSADYLRAEVAFIRGEYGVSLDRFADFVALYPDNDLVTAALSRMVNISQNTVERLNWEKISSLRVQEPYAQARLIVLQNKAMRGAPNAPSLSHPSAMPLVKWHWVGPFSSYYYTGFNDIQPFDGDDVLAGKYEYEGRKIEQFQYPIENVMTMAAGKSGIYAAETRIRLDKTTELLLTVQGSQFYSVYIDGKKVLTRDEKDVGRNSILASAFTLTEGEHNIRLRLGLNVSGNSVRHLLAWISPLDGNMADTGLLELDEVSGEIGSKKNVKNVERIDIKSVLGTETSFLPSNAFQAWTSGAMAVADGNAQLADVALNAALKKNPDDQIAKFWQALRYRNDADLDPAVRSEHVIRTIREVGAAAPQMVAALEILMAEFLRQGQPKPALDIWLERKDYMPDNADFYVLAKELAQNIGWTEIAEDYIEKAASKAPDSCRQMAAALKLEARKHAYTSYDALSETLRSCPQIIQFYASLEGNDSPEKVMSDGAVKNVGKDRWLQAMRELASKYPNDTSLRLEALNLRAQDDPEGAAADFIQLLTDTSTGYYTNISADKTLELIDRLRASGKDSVALRVIDKIIESYPVSEIIRNLEWYLKQERPFADLRIDGMQVIKDYLAQEREDAGSSVMILDYAATRIAPDGSKLGLTHQISRVLSKEGKYEIGEINLPDAASVLKIRTIKDGTFEIVEPETIAYKQSVSAPNLEVGDYVEVEYLTFDHATANDSRAVTDIFFYGSEQSPLVRSEYVVEYPQDWAVDIIESGPKNQINMECHPVDAYVRCTAKRENIPVFIGEPNTASSLDLIPSVAFYHQFDWNTVRRSLQETIEKQTRQTPYIEQFYKKIGVPEGDSVWTHARAIYDQVIASIDESESIQSGHDDSATNTITQGIGARSLALKALYDVAGIPSYFALVKSVASPENSDKLPALYNNSFATILVVDTEKGPAYVQPSEDFIPFDYLGLDFQNQTVIPLDMTRDIFTSRVDDTEQLRGEIDIDYVIGPDGAAQAKATEVMRGSRALVMRNFLNTVKNDTDKSEQVIQNSLANSYGRIALTHLEHENLQNNNKPLTLHYHFDIANFADKQDNKLNVISRIFAYNLVNQFAPLPHSERKYPVVVMSDMISKRKLTFRAPAGYSWNLSTLHDLDIATPYGKFSRHTKLDGAALEVSEMIEIKPQRVSLENYPEFRRFCLTVDEAQRTIISAVVKE